MTLHDSLHTETLAPEICFGLPLSRQLARAIGGDLVLHKSDPNLGSEWTEYAYLSTDLTTVTWNSGDGDLDLSKSASALSILEMIS